MFAQFTLIFFQYKMFKFKISMKPIIYSYHSFYENISLQLLISATQLIKINIFFTNQFFWVNCVLIHNYFAVTFPLLCSYIFRWCTCKKIFSVKKESCNMPYRIRRKRPTLRASFLMEFLKKKPFLNAPSLVNRAVRKWRSVNRK